ncbi:MAG: alpha/beta hydrolase, partial [Chloroflexota bacterium]|nr:alpha/beta hydrolase [Chloroflexota bacterium]
MKPQGTLRPPRPIHFARRGIARLAYTVSDDGERAVLLLHDLLADRMSMHGIRDAMTSTGFRVITPDARGHGASAAVSGLRASIAELALDVLAILDAGEHNQVHVIGIGLGATIGLDLTLVAPDRVERLVMIDPYLPGLVRDDADPEVRAAAADAREEAATIADLANKGSSDRALDRFYGSRFGPDWRTTLPKPRAAAMRRHANAFGPLLHAMNDYHPPEAIIRGVSNPALILLTDDLPELDRLAANRLRNWFSRARLEMSGEPRVIEAEIVWFLDGDDDLDCRPGAAG